MQNALLLSPVSLQVINGHPVTTSIDVAQHFGKRHADVIRAIRDLECSEELRQRNFASTSQEVKMPNGGIKQTIVFTIGRDGFVFLCMGFTGPQAARWKEAYITAFNEMEKALRSPANYRDIIKQAVAEHLGRLRVLVSMDGNLVTNMTLVDPGSLVFAPDELPDLIKTGGAHMPTALMPQIVEAAVKRLAEK